MQNNKPPILSFLGIILSWVLIGGFVPLASDTTGAVESDDDGSADGGGDADGDSDGDADGDSEGDTDAFEGDPSCENYPPSTGTWNVGDWVANYTFLDVNDVPTQICEFIEEYRLFLLKISMDTCMACWMELEMMIALGEELADEGVLVGEVQQAVSSQQALQDWVADLDVLSFRTVPPKQMANDYRKTMFLPTFGVYTLIDLKTMTVIDPKCGEKFEDGKQCVLDHL